MTEACEERLAEAISRMKEAEEMNSTFLSVLPLIMNVWDEDIRMISTSPQAVELFGLSSEDEYLEKFAQLSPEFQPCGTPSYIKAATFVKQAFIEGKVRFEWMHQTLNGEPLPTEIVLVRFRRGDKYFVAAYTFDMRRLSEAFSLTQTLVDSAPFAIKMWGGDHNIVTSNKQSQKLEELFGAKTHGEEFYKLSPANQPCGKPSAEVAQKYIEQAYEQGWVQFEWLHQTIDGTPFPAEITLVRSKNKDKTILIEYTVDLSPIKSAMERERILELKLKEHEMSEHIRIAEESSKAKSRFLARMSHEFRTPLTAIMGISEINIKKKTNKPQTEEAFRKINDSAHMLLGIANDILDLSKIEAGKMTLIGQEYNIASLVNDSVVPHIEVLKSKNIDFVVKVDESLPLTLIGDGLRIKQIINNLLSNACKYTESGSVGITFTADYPAEHEDRVNLLLLIWDTGLGMSESQLQILHHEYERFHESGANAPGGTGLGMPIVFNLVKFMNATINVKSEVNRGTDITVSIPQDISNSERIGPAMVRNLERFESLVTEAEKNKSDDVTPYPSAQVLVVDDVDANLYVAKGLLEFFEINVATCSNGYDAIDKIKEGNEYDIIFMDQMMPGINGTDTMKAIKATGYSKPIVALTASALIGQAEEYIESGFDGFVSKPLQTMQLSNVLQKFLENDSPDTRIKPGKKMKERIHNNDQVKDFYNDKDVQLKLRNDFVRDNKNAFIDISEAIMKGGFRKAHLIAHSLKGFAALIKETALSNAAQVVEHVLEKEQIPTSYQLKVLEERLNYVVKQIRLDSDNETPPSTQVNKGEALALFDKLLPILMERKAESLIFLDELKRIPDAKIPVRQIETFDFGSAYKSILVLKALYEE